MLHNESTEVLKIAGVRTSCGCMAVVPERRPMRPNENVPVDCVLALCGMTGRVSKTFWVTLDKARQGEVEGAGAGGAPQTATAISVPVPGEIGLTMTGEARERIGLHPQSVVFSAVRRGSPEQTLPVLVEGYVTNAAVTGFADSGTGRIFRVTLGPDGRSLAVALPGGLADGLYQETWQFSTSDPKTPVLALPVQARVRGSLWTVPERLSVRPGNEPVSCILLLRGEAGGPAFRVESVTAEPAFGVIAFSVSPGGSWRITVRNIVPDRLPAEAVLVIRTTQPECSELRVPVVRLREESGR